MKKTGDQPAFPGTEFSLRLGCNIDWPGMTIRQVYIGLMAHGITTGIATNSGDIEGERIATAAIDLADVLLRRRDKEEEDERQKRTHRQIDLAVILRTQ